MGTRYQGTVREVTALDTLIKLTRAADTVHGRLYTPLLREEGMTVSQLGVLEALLHLGPLSQGELSAKLLRSGSNLTTVVDNLEQRALVRRERDTVDRRVQVVHLTPAGEAAIRRVFPEHVHRVTSVFGVLTRDEQRQLAELCRKLGLANTD
jgi:MarR family 2-MHQ and catechol resistance regulon transcriptional repressor